MKTGGFSAPFLLAAFDALRRNPNSRTAHGATWLPKLLGPLLLGIGMFVAVEVASGNCVTPPAGLISWWRAEGDVTDALNLNNGTLQGGVTFVTGEVGQAFSFNGINTDVLVPDSVSLDFASNAPMSIELWAYRTGAETTMYLIGKRAANCGLVQYEMGFDPYNGLAFTTGNSSVATGFQMPMNTWMHLAATFDGTNTLKFYTNGVLAATGSGNLGPPISGPLILGNSSICAGFAGLIDEVSIYNSTLSAAAVQSIYTAGTTGKCFTPPNISTQPQSQTVLLGETVAFSVTATGGTPPYSYQWQMNNTNIGGVTTNNTLILTNIQTNQAGSYSVLVRGVGASVLSSNALLTVKTPMPGEVVVIDQAGLLSGLASGGNVTFAGSGTIVLSQTVVISQDTTLDATSNTVTISGNNVVQVFLVNSGVHFTLQNLTIANGLNMGATGAGGAGGGLYNSNGTVNVLQCDFVGNAAVGGAGGGGNGGSASGGAIYNNLGFLNVTNSFFFSNNVTGGTIGSGILGGSSYGGAICNNGGTINLAGSMFLSNSSTGGYGGGHQSGSSYGGAVHNGSGTLNVFGTSFTGNQSSCGLVASFVNGMTNGIGGTSSGGALSTLAGNVTVSNGTFYNNNAVSPNEANGAQPGMAFGGGIYQSSGTLNLVATTLATNSVMGGSGSAMSSFPANGYGGGVFNTGTLDSTNCNFFGNNVTGGGHFNGATAYGGAIFNQGTANLVGAMLSGNQALGGLGGYYMSGVGFTDGNAYGGGIFNGSTLLLLGCTLSQNTAVGQAVAAIGANGGGTFGGGVCNRGICFATNDTIVGNSATGGSPGPDAAGGSANGGGFFNQGGTVTFDYMTICSNSAIGGLGSPNGVGVGGGINATNGSLLLLDSIVAENPSGSDFYSSFGAITDGGDNISSDISFPFSASGSLNNTNPKLGVLGNYGGPTQTVPLLAGSPAIDAGGAGGCPATDQRGVSKPYGSACDIGAFEYIPSFSIQGQVQSFGPTGIISISAGIWSAATDNHGNYILNDVVPGTYSVTPSSSIAGISFSPSTKSITVGPSATNVNYFAILTNSLSVEGYSNTVLQLAVAGTNGQTEVVEISTNLRNWVPVSTNIVGTNGLLFFSLTNSGVPRAQFMRTVTP